MSVIFDNFIITIAIEYIVDQKIGLWWSLEVEVQILNFGNKDFCGFLTNFVFLNSEGIRYEVL